MRETRTHGSEGGGAGIQTGPSYPYQSYRPYGTQARFFAVLRMTGRCVQNDVWEGEGYPAEPCYVDYRSARQEALTLPSLSY